MNKSQNSYIHVFELNIYCTNLSIHPGTYIFFISIQKNHSKSLTCRHVQEGLKALVPQANTRFLCKISTRTKFWQSSCKQKHKHTCIYLPWWHHDMETISALLTLCEGNTPVTGRFPSQMASNVEFWCCLCCCPNKQSVKWAVILDAITLMWHHCYGYIHKYLCISFICIYI